MDQRHREIPRKLMLLLTLTAAITASNIYIAQPLLNEIGQSFHKAPSDMGLVLTLTQLGYVAGLILFGPLGDVLEKKSLLQVLLAVDSLVTLGAGLTQHFGLFLLLSLLSGMTSVQAQIVFPFVAGRGKPENRTRNLGLVISSCLLGVLLSRSLSGWLGQLWGWRSSYLVMGGLLAVLTLIVVLQMPRSEPDEKLSYIPLLKSLVSLAKERPAVRSIALTGCLVYASLNGFWASLAFYLQSPPFQLGTDAVGAFGILGLGGALASNLTGRFLPHLKVRTFLYGVVGLMGLSYLLMLLGGPSIAALVLAVVFLDMGAQAASISNQSEIYRLYHNAQARLNTIYKVLYFLGAALGSLLSTWAWEQAGWTGVCLVGLLLLALAMANVRNQPVYR